MGRSTQKNELSRFRNELSRSRRMREKDKHDIHWRKMKDLYRGKHYEGIEDADRMVINLAFANINVINPSVSINYPKFTVNPRTPESAAQAIVTEEVLNYLWRTHKWQAEYRLAVNDMLVCGHGWVKVGYKFVKEEVTTSEEPYEHADTEDEEVEGPVGETVITDKTIEDRPFVERISPHDIYVDPDARKLNEARWIAQRLWRPIKDVRSDKRYAETARRAVKPTKLSRYDDHSDDGRSISADEPMQGDEGYAEIIEWYDLKACTMSVFSRDGDEGFLVKPEKMPFSFGHPFVMLRNYEVMDEFYPMGELEAIEELQLELNATRTQLFNYRRRFSRKWLYRPEAFEETGASLLESDEDNVLVPVKEGWQDPLGDAVSPMPTAIFPSELWDHSQMIADDIQQVSGVSEYQRGATPEIRRTATEAAIIQDSLNARASDKLARVELTLAEIGERIVQLMQQYMTGDQTMRVVGMQFPVWVNYNKHYIQGQFDFEVEAGSTQPQNETFRRQSAMQLMDALAPLIDLGVVNPKALADHVLRYGFGLKTTANIVQDPPPPMPPEGEMMPQEGGEPMPPDGGGAPPPQGAPMPQGPPPAPMGPPPGPTLPDGTPIPPELLAAAEERGIPPEMLIQLLQARAAQQQGAPPAF